MSDNIPESAQRQYYENMRLQEEYDKEYQSRRPATYDDLREAFSIPEFTEEILDGLTANALRIHPKEFDGYAQTVWDHIYHAEYDQLGEMLAEQILDYLCRVVELPEEIKNEPEDIEGAILKQFEESRK